MFMPHADHPVMDTHSSCLTTLEQRTIQQCAMRF
jgi:hypothetical protein